MATKLRALYQRRKGRDLFDLWLCLNRKLINPKQVTSCFLKYIERESNTISRAQFEKNLHDKRSDPAFMDDIKPLLSSSVEYEPYEALHLVHTNLISQLPGKPWRENES